MNSTKKVAPKTALKKPVPEVIVVDLKKKVTPKSIFKTAPKITKKTAVLINGTKGGRVLKTLKKSSKTTTIPSHSKKMHSKFSTLEALHQKNQDQVLKSSLNTEKRIIVRPVRSLSLLSVYRFPVDAQAYAIKTARYGGVFFVVAGALFTLFFANGAFSVGSQTALLPLGTLTTTSTPLTTVNSTATTINCTDPLLYQSITCKSIVDISPAATFDIANRTTDLKGTVKVKVIVPYAQRVKLLAQNKNTAVTTELGLMTTVTSDSWELYWNTTGVLDGAYRLRVVIQNAHGLYEDIDTSNLNIDNIPLEIQQTATTTDTIATSSKETTDSVVTKETLNSNILESQTEFRFEIKDATADSIKLYAFHVATAKKIFLGNMYASSLGVWRFRWIATAMQEGEYKIIAQIISDGVPTYSSERMVKKLGGALIQTATTTVVSTQVAQPLSPLVSILMPTKNTLSGLFPLQIDVKNAAFVELYIQGQTSLVKKYLGIAKIVDIDTWSYTFNTTQIPNGEYSIVTVVKNAYGTYEQKTPIFIISNLQTIAYTPTQTDQIKTLQAVATEVEKKLPNNTVPATSTEQVNSEEIVALKIENTSNSVEASINIRTQELLSSEFKKLSNALRLKDERLINEIKSRILAIKNTTQDEYGTNSTTTQQNQIALDAYIRGRILKTEEAVFSTDKLIAERTKEKASEDTDTDGVSNYDEVAIYKTNPYKTDTDNDGFTDGTEILSGYNPVDAKNEALVVYESPQESGIIREDILKVTSVATEKKDDDTTAIGVQNPTALISGLALPNSFITLYIYSTPIVVTIKTDEDGGWNYRFDKELEDGEHIVYVGVTDNAGKIVAKSNPFSFVKTADAFTGVEGAPREKPQVLASNTNSFLSEYMIYLVLSVSTVAIGLVLILLGLHLDSRQRKFNVGIQQQEVSV